MRAELTGDLRLQEAVSRLQGVEAAPLLVLRSEHAHEDRRLREVGRRLHAGHRHEADPRILQVGTASESTFRIASLTFRRRSALARDDHLPLAAKELEVLRPEVAHDGVEQVLQLGVLARGARHGERRALPQVVVIHLCHGARNRSCSCAFADLTYFRFPLSDPESGKCSSTVRMPT